MGSLFLLALLIGLAASTATTIVRAVVPTLWLLIKPFSCDLCMSWWLSLAISVSRDHWRGLEIPDRALVTFAAVAISITVLKIHNRLSDIGTPPPLE